MLDDHVKPCPKSQLGWIWFNLVSVLSRALRTVLFYCCSTFDLFLMLQVRCWISWHHRTINLHCSSSPTACVSLWSSLFSVLQHQVAFLVLQQCSNNQSQQQLGRCALLRAVALQFTCCCLSCKSVLFCSDVSAWFLFGVFSCNSELLLQVIISSSLKR